MSRGKKLSCPYIEKSRQYYYLMLLICILRTTLNSSKSSGHFWGLSKCSCAAAEYRLMFYSELCKFILLHETPSLCCSSRP